MGSKLGWILSAVFVVVISLTAFIFMTRKPELPVTFTRRDIPMAVVKIPIEEITGSKPSASGNAADDYHKAVEIYQSNREKLDEISDKSDTSEQIELSAPNLALIEGIYTHIKAGAQKASMEYTLKYTKGDFKPSPDSAGDLANTANMVLWVLGRHYLIKKEYNKVEDLGQTMLVLGWHMTNENARGLMTLWGANVQYDSIGFLQELVKSESRGNDRVKLLEKYRSEAKGVLNDCNKKSSVIRCGNPNIGDALYAIDYLESRAWKVEAIIVLKYIRDYYQIKNLYFRQLCDQYLNKHRNSEDPYIKRAVESVDNMKGEGKAIRDLFAG